MVEGHKALNLFGYSAGALIGVIGANYVDMITGLSTVTEFVGGAVLFAIPVFFFKGNEGWEGPARLGLATAGLTLVLRALVNFSGIQAQLPPAFSVLSS